jgi:glycosyltransferase involved in cell wall biosynthesis
VNKFLFISNQYYPNVVGGAELNVQALAEELMKRGKEVAIASLSATSTDSIDYVNGIKVYRVAIDNLYVPFAPGTHSSIKRFLWHWYDVHNAKMAAKVALIADAERPDWVSTNNLSGFSVAVWAEIAARNIGLSHSIHDYYLLCPRTTMMRGTCNCARQCTICTALSAKKKRATEKVSVVIGVSQYALDNHIDRGYFPHATSTVIYNGGIPHDHVHRLPSTSGRKLRIGFIGRLEVSKGLDVLLRAVALLPEDSWVLRIAGKSTEPKYLEYLERTFLLPGITFLGFVAPAAFFPTIDVLVVPSLWQEPLGMVLYEAMSYGVPVIASNVGGIPEMLADSGAGWLFDSGDVNQLVARLRQLTPRWEGRDEMSRNALLRSAFFTVARQAEDFLRIVHAAGRKALAS